MSNVCDEVVGVGGVPGAVCPWVRVNKLGVIVGAEDVLEDEDARLCVLTGDDSRDAMEGGRGEERADAYTSNRDEEGV